jgi:hypothetical protein
MAGIVTGLDAGERCYWSNDYGWTPYRKLATVFERTDGKPIGNDAKWEPVSLADYDDQRARKEGWVLSERDDGIYEIQRLDCAMQFKLDCGALAYVRCKANAGSSMHKAAIALHGTRAKMEDAA